MSALLLPRWIIILESRRYASYDNAATESATTRWSGASNLAERAAHVHWNWRERRRWQRRECVDGSSDQRAATWVESLIIKELGSNIATPAVGKGGLRVHNHFLLWEASMSVSVVVGPMTFYSCLSLSPSTIYGVQSSTFAWAAQFLGNAIPRCECVASLLLIVGLCFDEWKVIATHRAILSVFERLESREHICTCWQESVSLCRRALVALISTSSRSANQGFEVEACMHVCYIPHSASDLSYMYFLCHNSGTRTCGLHGCLESVGLSQTFGPFAPNAGSFFTNDNFLSSFTLCVGGRAWGWCGISSLRWKRWVHLAVLGLFVLDTSFCVLFMNINEYLVTFLLF